ncbi:MAG TPA: hypothetical protein EYO85_04265, partial [Rhodospirillales bacterium]|nr:hypothetical protein [Rhodospirillales bacterium]
MDRATFDQVNAGLKIVAFGGAGIDDQQLFVIELIEGKRWIIDSTHATRSAALEVAEELLKAANHDGVRVVAENERTGEEEIIFEESIDRDDKVIK